MVIDRVISLVKEYLDVCVNHINMFNFSGGVYRTLEEFEKLFVDVNLKIKSVKKVQSSLSIIELERAW